MRQEDLHIDGFFFRQEEDARAAKEEKEKIKYIEGKMDYSDRRKVAAVYEKMVVKQMLHTPVGYCYLKSLQEFLKEEENAAVLDITVDYTAKKPSKYAVRDLQDRLQREEVKHERKKQEMRELKSRRLWLSVFLNLILAGLVIAMFAITINSTNPNILNYEKALTNRYAQWEQELTQRESEIKQKERDIIQN